MFFSSIYSIFSFNQYENSINNFNNEDIYWIKVLSFEKETQYMYKYIVKIRDKNIYLYASEKYSYGDKIKCKIQFEQPTSNTNLGGFNYKLFIYSNGISAIGYVSEVLDVEYETTGLMYNINQIKYNISQIINEKFENKTANIVRTMLLNDDSTIDVETKNIFYDIGIAHILVPSSTHLMYILMFVAYFGCILNIKSRMQSAITIMLISIYLVITNFAVSIARVFLMYIVGILFTFFCKDDVTHIQKMSIVLLLLLIDNPLILYNVGMLLSFVSVLAIQLLNNKVKYRLEYGLNRDNKNKVVKRVIEMISITISVQLLITPILMNCFNTIYVTSILANIFVVPLSGLLIILSIIFALIYNIPFVSEMFIFAINTITQLIVHISQFFNILPLSKILVSPLNFFEMLVYYFSIYSIFFSKKYYVLLKNMLKKIKRKAILLIVLVVILGVIYVGNYIKLSIQFIDVGQGDCTLIQTNGKNILIDGGGSTSKEFDVGQRVVLPYLLYKRVKKIDYMFVSHFDNDHFAGLKAVVNNIDVRNLVIAKQEDISKDFLEFMMLIQEKGINVLTVEKGERIGITEDIYIDILFPDNVYIPNNINNNSIVMKFIYYNVELLFTGDIEKEVEKYLIDNNINVKADILKVGHHGSKTSSTMQFLERINPIIGIIGVGKKNSFGHPSQEVISRLHGLNCKVYRTDINGEIVIEKYKNRLFNIRTMF